MKKIISVIMCICIISTAVYIYENKSIKGFVVNENDSTILNINNNEYPIRDGKLIWADEFTGTTLDTAKWNNNGATGAGGYGNQELQNYQMDYCEVKDGNLIIKPQFKWNKTTDSIVKNSVYSTKIWTKGLQHFKYGKIEVRAKIPKGQGTYATAWMLGQNNGWPLCGEIDLFETTKELSKTFIAQTIQCNRFNGMPTSAGCKSKTTQVNDATSTYHTYGIVWDEEKIKFTIDGRETWAYDPDKYQALGNGNEDMDIWPFNQPFYLTLSCAVGGVTGGNIKPDSWTLIDTQDNIQTYEDYMYVDYVRVYNLEQEKNIEETTEEVTTPKTITVKETANTETVPKVNTVKKISKVKLGKVSSPAKKKLYIKWKKVKKISGYEMYISLKKNFKSYTFKRKYKRSAIKTTIKGLKSKKKYYVKIRAYKKAGKKKYYGVWSKVKSVRIK